MQAQSTSRREVRVSDQDPEMLAIKAISAALEPLAPSARQRTMKWAESRYGTSALVDTLSDGLRVLSSGLDEIARSARLHQVTGEQMRAVADRIMAEAAQNQEGVSEGDPAPSERREAQ